MLRKRSEQVAREDKTPDELVYRDKTMLEELFEGLLTHYRVNGRKSADRVPYALKNLRDFFRERPARTVTLDLVKEYQKCRLDNDHAQPATINYETRMLCLAFRLAFESGKVAKALKVKTLVVNNVRKGFFEEHQFQGVLKPVAQVAYITGWRISEILSRQKRHLDLKSGWIRLEPGETKNGLGRMFPLTDDLQRILSDHQAAKEEFERLNGCIVPWLFHINGEPIKSFRKAWARACREAGCPGMLVHDFRRTAIRNFERSGISRSAGMAMSGHLTESIYSGTAS